MRYWLDTEFIERPCVIDLVSVGIVAEDGREFYAENAWADLERADAWFRANVGPHLKGGDHVMGHEEIGPAVLTFVGSDPAPEFWAYYADYDWVVFCWLFGRMVDLPERFPMFCRDIKQWAVDLGDPDLPKQDDAEHHALADARWNREAWEFLAALDSGPQAPGPKVSYTDLESALVAEREARGKGAQLTEALLVDFAVACAPSFHADEVERLAAKLAPSVLRASLSAVPAQEEER